MLTVKNDKSATSLAWLTQTACLSQASEVVNLSLLSEGQREKWPMFWVLDFRASGVSLCCIWQIFLEEEGQIPSIDSLGAMALARKNNYLVLIMGLKTMLKYEILKNPPSPFKRQNSALSPTYLKHSQYINGHKGEGIWHPWKLFSAITCQSYI